MPRPARQEFLPRRHCRRFRGRHTTLFFLTSLNALRYLKIIYYQFGRKQ